MVTLLTDQITDAAQARIWDGETEMRMTARPTPGAPNDLAMYPPDIADVILGLRFLSPAQTIEADGNTDHQIDAADIVLRSRYLSDHPRP